MNELNFEEMDNNDNFRPGSKKGSSQPQRDRQYGKRRWREIERLQEMLRLEKSLQEVFQDR